MTRDTGERTVVGEARLAETLEQVLLDLVRRHELGAEGTVEPWDGGDKDQNMSPPRPAIAH